MNEEKNIPEDQSTDNSMHEGNKGTKSSGGGAPAEQEGHQTIEMNLQPDSDLQFQTSKEKSEIKNMEVHHPHHVIPV